MAIIRSSDLDFDTIKTNLKTFFQKKSEFTGYDFEGAGLSNLLDVLAYNTHLNGLIANLAVNESFLNSAQLRSSVVSHAENLGYFPRSKSVAEATVTISASTSDTTTSSATLPAFSSFTGQIGETSYTFQTTEQYSAANDGSGGFSFKTSAGSTSIPIKEGTKKTKTFLVGETTEDQIYVIPDTNIDTATITVNVFDTATSSTSTTYTNVNKSVRIDTVSTVFIVRETPNGFYEMIFSDGRILGKAPEAGNKIVVTYLAGNGTEPNDISSFEAVNTISIGGVSYTLSVTTVSNSAGGSEKESLASIKLNAPMGFTSQQRMVTAEDYKALIKEHFSETIEDVASWGGQDNVPKKFGAVFISLKFKDGISAATQTQVKGNIVTELTNNLAIMSIDTEFTDPVDIFLECSTTFNFDPDLTGNSSESTETDVDNTISQFFTDNLSTFDSVFRKSTLLTSIDALSPAILDSKMSVKIQRRFTPTLNTVKNYDIDFPVTIAAADPNVRVVTSSRFTLSGQEAILVNKLNSTQLQVVNSTTQAVIQDAAGSYNPSTGVVSIVGVNMSAIIGSQIQISVTPADQDTIRPLRNYILRLDGGKSASSANTDFQNTATIISS